MDWGLIGSALFGGAAGYGEAGLEEIKQEREIARQEGLIRLQAEMNIEMSDRKFANEKTMADEMWEKTRTAAGEDYTRNRQDTVADREDLQAFQLGLIGEQAKFKGDNTPAQIQLMEWYKKNGLLDQAMREKNGGDVKPGDIAKAYGDYVGAMAELGKDPVSAQEFKGWFGSGTAAPATGGSSDPGAFLRDMMAQRQKLQNQATPTPQQGIVPRQSVAPSATMQPTHRSTYPITPAGSFNSTLKAEDRNKKNNLMSGH
jgi:hypothetical protein